MLHQNAIFLIFYNINSDFNHLCCTDLFFHENNTTSHPLLSPILPLERCDVVFLLTFYDFIQPYTLSERQQAKKLKKPLDS